MHRHPFDFLTVFGAICWLILAVYWAFSAVGVKKQVSGKGSSRAWALKRLVLLIIVIAIYRLPAFSSAWRLASGLWFFHNVGVRTTGAVLVAIGIALAIWARRHLGRNWSGHPTIKIDHELVVSGPYRYVRHPIYTGMLIALFGSGLVMGPLVMLLFILSLVMFIRRVHVEEFYMAQLFPDQYPPYRAKTRALMPLVW